MPISILPKLQPPPIQLDWAEGHNAAEIEITFQPTSEGYKTATLIVVSDDLVNPFILVPLGGEGVEESPPPLTLEDIIAFFDTVVEEDTCNSRLFFPPPTSTIGHAMETHLRYC